MNTLDKPEGTQPLAACFSKVNDITDLVKTIVVSLDYYLRSVDTGVAKTAHADMMKTTISASKLEQDAGILYDNLCNIKQELTELNNRIVAINT